MNKTILFLTIATIFATGQIIDAKSKKNPICAKQTVKKDKTAQDINNLLQELNNLFENNNNVSSVTDFLKTNKSFFETNKSKIQRFHKLMDDLFIGSEKRTAQKEMNFIYAFYLCDQITNPDNDEMIVNFVAQNYERNVTYINTVKHVKDLSFNHTAFSKKLKAIIKILKKDKIAKTSPINDKLLYSTINHLENIYYSVRNLGEFKQEKKKQNLHLTAEFAKRFFGVTNA